MNTTVESVSAKEYFTKLLQICADEIQVYLVINSDGVIAICESSRMARMIRRKIYNEMNATVKSTNAKAYFTALSQMCNDEKQVYLVNNSGIIIAICENERMVKKIKSTMK